MIFPDHFSGHADRYEAFRPSYPDKLFAYVASLAQSHDLACDCATGNGQAALGLTPHFRSIVALDASGQQLAQAAAHDRIVYVQALADRTPLPDGSVDLVTVASAFHWFDLPRFYREIRLPRPDRARSGGHSPRGARRPPGATPRTDGKSPGICTCRQEFTGGPGSKQDDNSLTLTSAKEKLLSGRINTSAWTNMLGKAMVFGIRA